MRWCGWPPMRTCCCARPRSSTGRTAAGLHLTARQAAAHAARAGVGKLVLTHLVPWNDRVRTLTEAAAEFRGPLSLATSGLVLGPGP